VKAVIQDAKVVRDKSGNPGVEGIIVFPSGEKPEGGDGEGKEEDQAEREEEAGNETGGRGPRAFSRRGSVWVFSRRRQEDGQQCGEREGEPEGGEVGIAVGNGVDADEDNAGNREKDAGEGGQSDGQSGDAAKGEEREEDEDEKKQEGKGDKPRCDREAWSLRDEGDGPEGFDQVEEVVGGKPVEPIEEGDVGDGSRLQESGDDGRRSGEEEERPFPKRKAREGMERVAKGEAAKGPEIEEEEEEGQGDEHGLGEKTAEEEKEGGGQEGGAAMDGRTLDAASRKGPEVAENGGEGEEGGEGVLAFGDPGDGFDAEGMERPEGRRQDGGECAMGGLSQDEEKEHGTGGVEEHVGQVEAPRGEGGRSEEDIVGKEREPEEGHVHAAVAMELREGLGNGAPGKSIGDDGVVGDEYRVVEIDERKGNGRREEGDGGDEEEYGGDDDACAFVVHGTLLGLEVVWRPLP